MPLSVAEYERFIIELANGAEDDSALRRQARMLRDPLFKRKPADDTAVAMLKSAMGPAIVEKLRVRAKEGDPIAHHALEENPSTISAVRAAVLRWYLRAMFFATPVTEDQTVEYVRLEILTAVRADRTFGFSENPEVSEGKKEVASALDWLATKVNLMKVCANPQCSSKERLFIASKVRLKHCSTACREEVDYERSRLNRVAASDTISSFGPKTEEGRKRIAEAQRKRHAKKRAVSRQTGVKSTALQKKGRAPSKKVK